MVLQDKIYALEVSLEATQGELARATAATDAATRDAARLGKQLSDKALSSSSAAATTAAAEAEVKNKQQTTKDDNGGGGGGGSSTDDAISALEIEVKNAVSMNSSGGNGNLFGGGGKKGSEYLVERAAAVRGDEAKRVSASLLTEKASKSGSSKDAHTQLLVELLRDALKCAKGQVLVVTSSQLNGAVTKTLKKCTDAKHAIAAFKDAHVELKALLKTIAASESSLPPHPKPKQAPTKGDWTPLLEVLSRHPPDSPLKARLLSTFRALVVAFDNLTPSQQALVAANASDIMRNLLFVAVAPAEAIQAMATTSSTSSSFTSSSSSVSSSRDRSSSNATTNPTTTRTTHQPAGSSSRDGSSSRPSSSSASGRKSASSSRPSSSSSSSTSSRVGSVTPRASLSSPATRPPVTAKLSLTKK